MTDEEEKPPKVTGWADLLSGGIPQLLLGPAGKAISRLIGAAVEIPAAKLDQLAQNIKDETSASTTVMKALAEATAKHAVSDPVRLDRGLANLVGKAYREQENRDAVAKEAVEQLVQDPPPADNPGPSDDWLNVFEEHAARASSDNLRSLFGRILAGEIRKPGSFSLSTLHFVSVLDAEVAALVQRLAPYTWDRYAFKDAVEGKLKHVELLVLEEAGFLNMGSGFLTATLTPIDDGYVMFRHKTVALAAVFDSQIPVKLPIYVVSRPGRELIDAIVTEPDVVGSAKALWKLGAKMVRSGSVIWHEGSKFQASFNRDLSKDA
jgi:hypothetical protein